MRKMKLFVVSVAVFGLIFLNSCGSDSDGKIQEMSRELEVSESEVLESEVLESEMIQVLEQNDIENDIKMETDSNSDILEKGEESISAILEQKTVEELYEFGIVVNVEEADVTHDGVMDKIVTRIYPVNRHNAKDDLIGKTAKELLEDYATCMVSVYDGNEWVEEGMDFKGEGIWSKDFSMSHVGNGQLYLVNHGGKDYLIWNVDYCSTGYASYEYRMFYLNGKEEEVVEKNGIDFPVSAFFLQDAISIDEMIAYTEDLDRKLNGSTLLVYCSGDARIRTFDEECSADVFDLWDWLKSEDFSDDFTMESLREALGQYYDELDRKRQGIEPEILAFQKDALSNQSVETETSAFEERDWKAIVVNVEEADFTHDGIMDKIVTRITYAGLEEKITARELLRAMKVYKISVYDGNGLMEDGTDFEENCIWEKEFSSVHPLNGQLYRINREGEDYLVWNTDYTIMGHFLYAYRVFYLTSECEEIVEAEDSGHFTYDNMCSGNVEFPVDHLIDYTEDLKKQLEGSELLIYCSIGDEDRIRTFDEACSADIFELWNWLKSWNEKEDFTMETLREAMERYYVEEWDRKKERE